MDGKKYILHQIPGQIETIYLAEYPGLFDSLMPGTIRKPPLTFRAVMPLMMLPPDIRKKRKGARS